MQQPYYDDGHELYEYDEGPQIVPPTDARAAAILDGFRMCACQRFSSSPWPELRADGRRSRARSSRLRCLSSSQKDAPQTRIIAQRAPRPTQMQRHAERIEPARVEREKARQVAARGVAREDEARRVGADGGY